MLVAIKLYWCIFLFLGFLPLQESLLGGLKFHGGEQPIDQRTSYNVFGDHVPAFSDSFHIEFKLTLYPAKQIGYIFRIKNKESNKIYNLFYDAQGNQLTFKLNEEGKNNLVVANIEKDELLNRTWFKMKISFDLENDRITLAIHNQAFGAENVGLPDTYYPIILFGKSDHIIDVPSFAIKDLSVGNVEKYNYPLKENEGKVVHEFNGKATGEVLNPDWLINEAYHWKHKASFQSKSVAGANYNPEKKEIYYFNQDSLLIYNVRSGDTRSEVFEEKSPVKLILGTNFIDPTHNKLVAYEVYYATPNDAYDGPTVASLDLETYQWTAENSSQLPTQLHHHGSYLDPGAGQYTLFGGFGNMHYSKNFFSYDLNSRQWDTLKGFSGDFLSPRYFSSVGHLKKTNSLYIFGGMGNESGEQTVGRKYYYDLYRVDLNTKHITKLWEIAWEKDNVVPVRGMVILNDSCFYTLCYPEHFTDSFLKLYRFSLRDGSYEILGDSIPIASDRITTNANLYYDSLLNNLYAVVQEFDDDISSDLKVYSLAFPPVTAQELVSFSRGKSSRSLIGGIILFCFAAAVGLGYLLVKKRKPRPASSEEYSLNLPGSDSKAKKVLPVTDSKTKKAMKPNSIYLFGDFMVRDRNNKDITYLFSSKLKQVFCVILQSSAQDLITSQRLSEILWPDKPATKVKNSRGVTINHLRKALGELDGLELIYEKGCFKFVQTAEFYCDYTKCMEIISSTNGQDENREALIEILSRGKFLKFSNDPSFDSFKEATEQKLEPLLLLEMEKSFAAESYSATIHLAETVFNIDPLNDTALEFQIKAMQKLKMDKEAKLRHQSFMIEYKNAMGNDYPKPLKL